MVTLEKKGIKPKDSREEEETLERKHLQNWKRRYNHYRKVDSFATTDDKQQSKGSKPHPHPST